jgi:hypothetical protein
MYPNAFFQQYNNAYPHLHWQNPPSAVNGYGWHGNGYGWQVDPSQWKTHNIYPSSEGAEDAETQVEAVEEPLVQAQKVDKVESYLGERNSGLQSRGPVQDFYELRDQHLANGTLFEDPQFPAEDSSLFYSQRPDRHVRWMRPHVSYK